MSSMIQCDACKCTMYDDSRSEKGSYFELWIDRSSQFHLCRRCYDKMMRNIFRMTWSEDEEQYTDEGVLPHWIFGSAMGHSYMKCSECCVSQSGQTACFAYCPNCGSYMSGEVEYEE